MYGYDIPRYMRDYQREWQRFDRFLRVRRSLDYPGAYVLERKTRYLVEHDFTRGSDYQVQLKDDYRQILVFDPKDAHRVADHLRQFDLQRTGYKALAQELEARQERDREREDRARQDEFDAIGSEAYDFLAWREGRRVAT